MAFPSWMYRDPMRINLVHSKYRIGCHACIRNRYDKKIGWHCLLKHKDYPRLDMDTCKDWKKQSKIIGEVE